MRSTVWDYSGETLSGGVTAVVVVVVAGGEVKVKCDGI